MRNDEELNEMFRMILLAVYFMIAIFFALIGLLFIYVIDYI